VGVAAAALVGVPLLAAACSSGAPDPGIAQVGAAATTSTTVANRGGLPAPSKAQSLEFSQCMRSHGVPKFPDPNGNGAIAFGPNSGIDPKSPSFQRAMHACQKYQPQPSAAQRAQMLANLLKFSECMRAHGISDFPDPKTSGNGVGLHIRINGGGSSDLDPNNPLFQRAQTACQRYLPGGKAPSASKGGGPEHHSGGGMVMVP
jgi:hypothetical protein